MEIARLMKQLAWASEVLLGLVLSPSMAAAQFYADVRDNGPLDLRGFGSFFEQGTVKSGKPLALDFARQFLPGDFDGVRQFFSRRGAYAKFKNLLDRRGMLDQWHAFEAEAEERALKMWCDLNSIEVSD